MCSCLLLLFADSTAICFISISRARKMGHFIRIYRKWNKTAKPRDQGCLNVYTIVWMKTSSGCMGEARTPGRSPTLASSRNGACNLWSHPQELECIEACKRIIAICVTNLTNWFCANGGRIFAWDPFSELLRFADVLSMSRIICSAQKFPVYLHRLEFLMNCHYNVNEPKRLGRVRFTRNIDLHFGEGETLHLGDTKKTSRIVKQVICHVVSGR